MTDGTAQKNAPVGGCWVILVVLPIIMFIASLGDSDSTRDNAAGESNTLTSDGWAEDGEDSTAAASISHDAVRQAARHAERTIGALKGEGAMLYSETCQASLERSFSMADYDRCYAFDLFASRMLEIGDAYAVLHFSESSIRSRWSRASLKSDASAAVLEKRREAAAAAVSRIPVSLEAPPVPAALAETVMQDEPTSSGLVRDEDATDPREVNTGDELPSELGPID